MHLLAGGVSDAIYGGKSTDDALDKLRADKPTRFRVEQRLPNPTDGDLSVAGCRTTGTLDGRALAHLMRYCEDYVITCAIEVWRGNENARVEYKRGEISGVTVGGIDAPERLAEVMQWSSGNYRLMVPASSCRPWRPSARRPASAAPAPVPAPAPSAQAARQSSATKTIFGMPAAEITKARAAAEAAKAAKAAPPGTPTTPPPPPAAIALRRVGDAGARGRARARAAPAAWPRRGHRAEPGARADDARRRSSATKTIFGVPAPGRPGVHTGQRARSPARPLATSEADSNRTGPPRSTRKTGARKVDVPTPEVAPPAAAPPAAAPPRAAAAAGRDAHGRERAAADDAAGIRLARRRAQAPEPPPRSLRSDRASRAARRRSGPTSASASSSVASCSASTSWYGLLAH